MFQRGYKVLSKQLESKGKFVADCRSCDYWYAPRGSEIECCNNQGVTQFDMAERESGAEYCTFWIPSGRRKEVNGKI